MNQHYEAFRKKLQEIFMMDHAELDFGIYRIMNHKRGQINDFLDKQLLPQVEKTLQEYVKTDDSLQQELTKAVEGCKNLGIAPDTNPKVLQLRQQIDQSSTGIDDLQNTVFSRLTQFFSRYYEGGDFVSQRRYKSGGNSAYAIPYNGEEVKLYWANYDQYYIKTSEYFKNYTFKLRDGRRICFVLVDASTEQNNNKNTNGMERRFDILRTEEGQPVVEEVDGELHISFTYELMPKATKQKDLNEKAFEALSAVVPAGWQDLLMKEQVTDENVLLKKHINIYTAKNSFDYFIHKDLGGFLSRELDFYIKNEVFVIADLDAAKLQSQLPVVKAIEKVGQKIIDFLAQLENFQKHLWLKKKFVVQSDYCITLDRVPEKFYSEICANDAQRREWVRLFAIDDIQGDMMTEAYSEPLTIEFLKQNPFLVLDTAFFDAKFKHQIEASIEDLDDQINGLLINSENFQALKLLQEKYAKGVDCVYIDPPYNTNATPILYKNSYRDSSWMTFIQDRVSLSKCLTTKDGYHSVAIDDVELHNLYKVLEQNFVDYDIFQCIVNHYPGSGTGRSNVSKTHEYNLFVLPHDTDILRGNPIEERERVRGFCRSGTGENNHRYGRPNSFYAVLVDEKTKEIKGVETPPAPNDKNYPTGKTEDGWLRIYPLGSNGVERCWSLGFETAKEAIKNGKLRCTSSNVIQRLYFDESDWELLPSLWVDATFSAVTYGTNLLTNIFGSSGLFSFPKSLYTVIKAVYAGTYLKEEGLVLDYFGGSGTTAHAVMCINKKYGGNRKYILCEMGTYFDNVTRCRVEKAIYSEDWNNGKPVSRKGVSQCFKYIRLEQYEDTLNNLEVNEGFGKPDNESYVLRYMLDTETRDSLINTKDFVRPFDYTIKTTRDNELVDTPVDLVDTFNYLIGLHVDSIHWHKDDNICVVEGTTHIEKEHALVIWRNQDVIKNDDLNDFFRKQDYSTLDREFDVIYVNGDNTLPNIKSDEEHWKVRLIEQELMKRMFEGE